MNIRTRLSHFPPNHLALVDNGNRYTYHHFLAMVDMIARDGFKSGRIVSVIGRPNPYNIAKLIAAIDARSIVVPMAKLVSPVVWKSDPAMYSALRKSCEAGMVFFRDGKPWLCNMSKELEALNIETPQLWKQDLDFAGEHRIEGYYDLDQTMLLLSILTNGGTVIINN